MRPGRNLRTIVTTLAVLLSAVGCQQTPSSSSTASEKADDIVATGRRAERIISLAPCNTEILFTLGLGDRVVGVSERCDFPPEAKKVEQIGTPEELDYEKIVELAPDLILATELNSKEAIARLDQLGLPVVVLEAQNVFAVLSNIERVGRLTGTEERADKLVAELEERVDNVLAKMQKTCAFGKPCNRLRVFLEIDSDLTTVGPDTVMDALIKMAGGINIATDTGDEYPQFGVEEIIRQNPEVIVLADSHLGVTTEMVKTRPGWEGITAVKKDDIYPIDRDIITRPGPRIVDGLEELAQMVQCARFDPQARLRAWLIFLISCAALMVVGVVVNSLGLGGTNSRRKG
jgi:iron complex transport system substrate-binding protein